MTSFTIENLRILQSILWTMRILVKTEIITLHSIVTFFDATTIQKSFTVKPV